MKITTYPHFNMENSKIENIFPYFFTFIFIFTSISQKYPKIWVKTFFNWLSFSKILSTSSSFLPQLVKTIFHRLSRKLPYNLILVWIIQKSNWFSQIFSSSSSSLTRLVKNGLKNKPKFFFSDFHKNFCIT